MLLAYSTLIQSPLMHLHHKMDIFSYEALSGKVLHHHSVLVQFGHHG